MPIPVACASCGTKLVAPDAAAGKKVKCRNCQSVVAVPTPAVAEESDFEFVEQTPVAPAKPGARPVVAAMPAKPKVKPAMVVDDDEENDTPPRKKPRAIMDEDDEDDRPRRSQKKSKTAVIRDDEDDDSDEDDAPRKSNRKGKKPAKKKTNPLVFAGLGVVALLAVGFLGVMVWYVAGRDKATTAGTNVSAAPGGPVPPADPLAGWTRHDKVTFSAYFKDSLGKPLVSGSFDQLGPKTESVNAVNVRTRQIISVTVAAMPSDLFAHWKADPPNRFKPAVSPGHTVLSSKEITVYGHYGRELNLRTKDGQTSVERAVMAYDRLYLYSASEPDMTDQSEFCRTFLDNFKIKP